MVEVHACQRLEAIGLADLRVAEREVVAESARDDRSVLLHEAYEPSVPHIRIGGLSDPRYAHGSPLRRVETCDEIEDGALARARRPDDPDLRPPAERRM